MARFDDKKLQTDNLVDKLVSINRVSKTVKGGRNMSFSALVVVGDKSWSVLVKVKRWKSKPLFRKQPKQRKRK